MPDFEKELSVPGLDRNIIFEFEFDVQPTGPDFEETEIFIESATPLRADDGEALSDDEKQIAETYLASEIEKGEDGVPFQFVRNILDGIDKE